MQDAAEPIAGFYAPVHRALTEHILLGGAPRSIAIMNGTLAGAVGLGLRLWLVGLAIWAARIVYRRWPKAVAYLIPYIEAEKERTGTIRMLLAAIKQKEVDERVEVDDAGVIALVDKLIKQRRDAITQYQAGGRSDLADKEAADKKAAEEKAAAEKAEAELARTRAALDLVGKAHALLETLSESAEPPRRSPRRSPRPRM